MRTDIIKLMFRNFYNFIKNYQISRFFWVPFLILVSGTIIFTLLQKANQIEKIEITLAKIKKPESKTGILEKKKRPKPGPISMKKMKTQGCVADGILSEYGGDTNEAVALINRSNCYYLHRSLETWADTPDFEKAEEIMNKITKPNVVYGMFLSETIKRNAKYFNPEKNRNFKFSDMCRGHSDGAWGEHTCIPSLEKEEYQDYLKYITRRAMDLGIQSFLFGQIYFQETAGDREHSEIFDVIKDMREYANEIGIEIVIGAQTGTITNEKYIKAFDYIEGGVGINSQGEIENGPCWSRKSSCWALLWHPNFSQKANNVFLHLDWSGLLYDDMSVFSRMDKNSREKTLKNLYTYFTSRDMGFLMPYLAVIHKQNGGCYGPKKRFYSPSNKYNCQDEYAIKRIMSGN